MKYEFLIFPYIFQCGGLRLPFMESYDFSYNLFERPLYPYPNIQHQEFIIYINYDL